MILLKHFKKVKSDSKTTDLIHKDGHKISIAHNALSPKMKKQLSELPHMYDGGEAKSGLHADYSQDMRRTQAQESYTGQKTRVHEDTDREYAERRKKFGEDAPRLSLPAGMADGGSVEQDMGSAWRNFTGQQAPNQESTQDNPFAKNIGAFQNFKDTMTPQNAEAPTSEQLSNVSIASPQPNVQPQNSMGTMVNQQANSMQSQVQNYEQGVGAEARAVGAQGKQEAQAAQQHQQQMQATQDNYNQKSQEIDAERMAVYNDLKNGHIEPQHYLQNLSGFGQAMTAIGLALGGYGAGINGGSNQAMDFLNKQIDRDIEAQKAEMGKKENLLTHLNQQFGNLKDATTMAKAMQMDLYSTKMQELAATSKDPIAQAKAQQIIADWHMKNEPEIMQMKMRQAALSGLQNGSGNAEQAIPYLVPKEHQKAAFDSLGKLKDLNQNASVMDNLFRKAAEENTILRTGAGLVRTPASVTNLQNMFLPIVKDLEGRINDYEFESVKKFIPAPGDLDSKIQEKYEGMRNFIAQKNNEHSSVLRSFGVPVPQGPKGFNRR